MCVPISFLEMDTEYNTKSTNSNDAGITLVGFLIVLPTFEGCSLNLPVGQTFILDVGLFSFTRTTVLVVYEFIL